jgi:NADPH-dependent 2,4-dienoyl-CoA reductase/sulfur reductase-like enzyme
MSSDTFNVVIVGGGPAGLAAALELARAGASVAIVEESSDLGGQYFKRRHGAILECHGDYRPAGSALIAAVRAAGVTCLTETFVWGAEGGTLWTSGVRDGAIGPVRGRFTLLATGAYERAVPFPGWTLPGVCTPGCALHFATIDRVGIGRRVLVAGTGPFLLPVACALLEVGTHVVRLLEINAPYQPMPRVLQAASHPARLAELAGYMSTLRRHGVRIRQGWRVIAASGQGRVEKVTIGPAGPGEPHESEELTVDAVCVGYGFRPSTELARLLGCACSVDPLTGDPIPITDEAGRTSIPTIFVAGEVRGIAGVHAALARGRLAAYALMAELGLRPAPRQKVLRDRWLARRLDAFARLTAQLFPLPAWLYESIPDHTLVCRCECVSAAEIRQAAGSGGHDVHATKGMTRAGMGLCQGRQCGHVVAALVAQAGGHDGAASVFAPRTPLKPLLYPQPPTHRVSGASTL